MVVHSFTKVAIITLQVGSSFSIPEFICNSASGMLSDDALEFVASFVLLTFSLLTFL